MPIRFRCAYCNQLMGIARRKAGTVVRCPKCAGQVIVPDPGPGDVDPPSPGPGPKPPAAAPPGSPALFERSDFAKMFEPAPVAPPPTAAGPPQPFVAPAPAGEVGFDVEPLPYGIQGGGIFLTATKLTVISVAMVILLALAFFVGLLVGRSS